MLTLAYWHFVIEYEEGTKLSPYIDSLGYPTIGTGFKIGLQNVPIKDYVFTIMQETNDVWLQSLVAVTQQQIPGVKAFIAVVNATERQAQKTH